MAKFDLIIRGGRVIDPAQDIDAVRDVAVKNGTIAQVAPRIAGTAPRTLDARNNLVVPGMIDTHSHIYQHVTGDFGMNPDEVGLRSGVTAVVDQGGVAPLTIQGFRKFIKGRAAFVSRHGKVHPLIFEGMARGVRIDLGRGGHMSFDAARIALDAGVMPFIIGGDIHGCTIRRRDENRVWGAGTFGGEQGELTTIGGTGAFSLVQVMNELIALGVGLTDVIRMVTVNAASMLGLTDELGSLAPGRVADVSVLAIDEDDWTLQDSLGVRIKTDKRLRPVLALRAGEVHRSESPLLDEQVPAVA